MDPNACLKLIADSDDRDDRAEHCKDLQRWLSRGGFEPNWDHCPRGATYYRTWLDRQAMSMP